jgi:hypothetical protein
MTYRGFGGTVEVMGDGLVISRHGVLSFFAQGLKGQKSIPFSSITAVQFKPASIWTNGYIQFSIKGGIENRGGLMSAGGDENSVIFQEKSQAQFEELKALVERKIAESKTASSPASVADEIAKFAALRDQGILTSEEFDKKKRLLLGI